MVNAESVRTKVENKIFQALGSSALWASQITPSLNKWGDDVNTSQFSSDASITIVPYYLLDSNQEFFDFGDLEKGEMDIAMRYNSGVSINDRITFNSKLYKVKAIEDYILKDVSLVKIARLSEFL
ncbi:MAG TPA: hypothetical protein V6C58_06540 [Allocoleopsis sp.]